MSRKKYVVELSSDERAHLEARISKGKASAKAILKTRILLKADQGPLGPSWTDDRIVEALDSNASMVNLNTHTPASLYRAFPPAEARRIANRFEWHYTPKHGSWLNMAEAELSVLARQCLARRIPDIATLEQHVVAWLQRRNKHHINADWRFTTKDARIKLKNLYPVL